MGNKAQRIATMLMGRKILHHKVVDFLQNYLKYYSHLNSCKPFLEVQLIL